MKNKKRMVSALALSMAALMAMSGTLAWQSISQKAKNEKRGIANPGGRLHDDFNGSNKDIYVENFTDKEGGVDIYARVRLSQYMEIGKDAGTTPAEGTTKEAEPLVTGADFNDVDTWTIYTPGETTFSEYWKWETGGSTIYMPTFNKNKDSKKADVNGTWAATNPDDENDHFFDYIDYVGKGAGYVIKEDAVYDNDLNDKEEENPIEDENIKIVEETHATKETLTGTIKTMDEWLTNPVQGPYWVWDTDGWAYWAQPITPDTATGLLLNGIELIGDVNTNWYYSINVVGQFITADDLGRKDGSGFYDPNTTEPSENALKLLETIGVDTAEADPVITVTVNEENGATTAEAGDYLKFTAAVEKDGTPIESPYITWAVSGNDTCTISWDGKLKICDDVPEGTELTITATYVDDAQNETEGIYKLRIVGTSTS